MKIQQQLENRIVRIKVRDNEFGSGFIYEVDTSKQFLYVFTARHNIYGDNYSIKTKVSEIKVQLLIDESFLDIPIHDVVSSKINDFAILIIYEKEIRDIVDTNFFNIPIIKDFDQLKGKILFKGFPNRLNCENSHKLNGIIEDYDRNNSIFEIQVTQELYDFENDSKENIKGFSGSGIFIKYPNNRLKLAGIITSYKGGFRTVKGYFFSDEVNTLLEQHNYHLISALKPKQKKIQKTMPVSKTLEQTENVKYFIDIVDENLRRLKNSLFPLIRDGEAILIIGPEVLTREKSFDEIIQELYEEKYDSDFQNEAENIVDFVDTVFTLEGHQRKHFDKIVSQYLDSLESFELHKIIANNQWRAIITTNQDKLLEQSFDDNQDRLQKLVKVASFREFKSGRLKSDLIFIKLNGDITDRSKYPLVFSENDFKTVNKFYKRVFTYLNDLHHDVPILFVGFNYKNKFSKILLGKLRLKRPIYLIDQNISHKRLEKLQQEKIFAIRTDYDSFFQAFQDWSNKDSNTKSKQIRNPYVNKDNNYIHLNSRDILTLSSNIRQFDGRHEIKIEQKEYYQGKEPTYYVIKHRYDIIKRNKLNSVKAELLTYINSNTNVPMCLLTGGFGTGKTTFTLRLIADILSDDKLDFLGFEILDLAKVHIEKLLRLINKSKAKNIILYTDHIEKDSIFSAFFNLQKKILQELNPEVKIILLASIRKNILNKFNRKKLYNSLFEEINIDCPFNINETQDLLKKLEETRLIKFQDNVHRKEIAQKINKEYKGDTLISLYKLIENSKHKDYIIDAYDELTSEMKDAFLYTSLLHRYNILMPLALLKDVLNKSYEDLEIQIIKGEGKGILEHDEIKTETGLNDSFYFWTRHPLIAETLVNSILKNQKAQYEAYRRLISKFRENDDYARKVIDLLKSIEKNRQGSNIDKKQQLSNLKKNIKLSSFFIDKLYDEASKIYSDNPHFILHYAMNLQNRNKKDGKFTTDKDLLKAHDLIRTIRGEQEETYYQRNHLLIHRQGTIAFSLARYYLEDFKENLALTKIEEAIGYFSVKKMLDPDSSYSYTNYIKLLLWILQYQQKLRLHNYELVDYKTQLELLFDEAKYIYNGKEQIEELRREYNKKYGNNFNLKTAEELERDINNFDLDEQPYLLVQLYYFYSNTLNSYKKNIIKSNKEYSLLEWKTKISQIQEKMERTIDQLITFKDIETVTLVLFKHYGRRLHIPNYLTKFFDLVRDFNYLEQKDFLRFNYYNFIAESYNQQYYFAKEYLFKLRKQYGYTRLNPNTREEWKQEDGTAKIFIGNIQKEKDRYSVKIRKLQRSIPIISGIHDKNDSTITVKLYFYLSGLKAEIVDN